jgi:hypothetical protein
LAKSLDDDHQFGYNTELERKKKKEKEHTNTHKPGHTYATMWGQVTQKQIGNKRALKQFSCT